MDYEKKMSIHKTQAIVLNKRDFRETSLIADFYTLDFGKITGLLKGIRKEPQKFSSTLEPFSYNEIVFYKKRNSSLHLVTQCDIKDNFNSLRINIFKAGVASLMMELVSTIMAQEDKNEAIFNLILTFFRELELSSNPEKIMIFFKIKILTLSGFKPHFDSCVNCGVKVSSDAKFSLKQGGLLCNQCFRKDPIARSIFLGTIASILYIEKNDFKNLLNLGMNPQIKKELDIILNSFLTFHLEKDFKAQRVLDQMRPVANRVLVNKFADADK